MTPIVFCRSRKRLAILLASTLAVALIITFISWQNYQNRPRDLGPNLRYTGRLDSGCIFLCDSMPSTDYYFATDMTIPELAANFKHADCELPQVSEWSMGCYYYDHTQYHYRHLLFSMVYYSNRPIDLKSYDSTIVELFNKTHKSLIVTISKDSYHKAMHAL